MRFTEKIFAALDAGLDAGQRHAEWDSEVHLQVIRAVAERERRSLLANMIGWVACVIAALSLPNGQYFAVPLAFRLFSIFYARFAWRRFRSKIENYEPHEEAMKLAQISLAVSGFFWGLLMFPLALLPSLTPPALVIMMVTTIGVSLVSAMLGSLPKLLISYYAIFAATLVGFVFVTSAQFNGWIAVLTLLAGAGIIAYALGAGREHLATANTLLENKRLSYELSRALERAKDLAERDPLTRLLNRRAFFDSERTGWGASAGVLLAVDLDHFKSVNDCFGHAIGDKVLADTANVMAKLLRGLPGGPHCAARLGGEEFAVRLVGLERAAALAVAEALRKRIAAIPDKIDVDGLKVTASIGFTTFQPHETVEEALACADEALYRAKNQGRNQVVDLAA